MPQSIWFLCLFRKRPLWPKALVTTMAATGSCEVREMLGCGKGGGWIFQVAGVGRFFISQKNGVWRPSFRENRGHGKIFFLLKVAMEIFEGMGGEEIVHFDQWIRCAGQLSRHDKFC